MNQPELSRSQGSVTDVRGVRVGHATTPNGRSGCTVLDFPDGAVAGMDVRGGGAGTRQTDSLRGFHSVQRINALCLSGGSALGLSTSQGVLDALREQERGYAVRGHFVPIVPAAILFDLLVSEGEIPGPREGRAALLAATETPQRGSVGAGAGATVGKWFGVEGAMRGGLGMSSARLGDVSVGILAVVNAFGDILDDKGGLLAGARDPQQPHVLADTEALLLNGVAYAPAPDLAGMTHTNLIVAVTDAVLTREEVRHFAAMAHNGVTTSVRPAHLSFDGDVAFGAATGQVDEVVAVDRLGALAAKLVALAMRDAVQSAGTLPDLPSWNDRETWPVANAKS